MIEVEERPVFDRLEDVPVPSEALKIVGRDNALNQLTQAYASGKMHHAWLISSAKGSGKASLAFAFAKHIFTHRDQRTAPDTFDPTRISDTAHKQVSNGGHPELLHLTRPWDEKTKKFKTQLSVDEVRRTVGFYGMTAGAGGWRITIVDAADDMNASAANALLKILEEPPKRSLFFVLTHAAGGLLPTIRSRCQSLSLRPLDDQQVVSVLEHLNIQASDADKKTASQLCEGSPRRAIQLLRGDVIKQFELFQTLMTNNANGTARDWNAVHKIADNLSRRGNEESFSLFVDLASGWIGGQVRGSSDTGHVELASWAEVWDKVARSVTVADAFNLDKKQVILSLFGTLFERNKIFAT